LFMPRSRNGGSGPSEGSRAVFREPMGVSLRLHGHHYRTVHFRRPSGSHGSQVDIHKWHVCTTDLPGLVLVLYDERRPAHVCLLAMTSIFSARRGTGFTMDGLGVKSVEVHLDRSLIFCCPVLLSTMFPACFIDEAPHGHSASCMRPGRSITLGLAMPRVRWSGRLRHPLEGLLRRREKSRARHGVPAGALVSRLGGSTTSSYLDTT